jgi:c(7)-type cytochrome triheme protein
VTVRRAVPRRIAVAAAALALALAAALPAGRDAHGAIGWLLPATAPPDQYGTVLISRTSAASGQQPVVFSHWLHRTKYTCRVCHFELYFAMQTNATEITEEKNRAGEYCGACHDGKEAFGHTEPNCGRCHAGDVAAGAKDFGRLSFFPENPFGNGVDWMAALDEGKIKPRQSLLEKDYVQVPYRKSFDLEAEWARIPPAVFSHASHNRWLDCSICHPDIFNIRKKSTAHFEMKYILEGKFCGACHLTVAFPIDDCKRCHPGLR